MITHQIPSCQRDPKVRWRSRTPSAATSPIGGHYSFFPETSAVNNLFTNSTEVVSLQHKSFVFSADCKRSTVHLLLFKHQQWHLPLPRPHLKSRQTRNTHYSPLHTIAFLTQTNPHLGTGTVESAHSSRGRLHASPSNQPVAAYHGGGRSPALVCTKAGRGGGRVQPSKKKSAPQNAPNSWRTYWLSTSRPLPPPPPNEVAILWLPVSAHHT